MRHFLVLFLLLAVLLPNSAFAQTDDAASTPTPAAKTPIRTQVQDAVKARNQAISEATDAMKDKMTAAREAYKEKLAAIKDERKQAVVAKIDTRLNEINEKSTMRLSERVTRLTQILDRIASEASSLEEEDAALNTQIETARDALDEAMRAIEAQAAKDYVVNVTTETALKNAVSTTIRQFATDIKAVHKLVVDAQKEIREAHVMLKELAEGADTSE